MHTDEDRTDVFHFHKNQHPVGQKRRQQAFKQILYPLLIMSSDNECKMHHKENKGMRKIDVEVM